METRLSIENPCFTSLRAALDEELQETVARMLDLRAGECAVAMQIRIELEGVDEMGRKLPSIHYKVSSSIPMKRDMKARLAVPVLLDEGPDGVMVIQEYEQTSML